jgi:hypothetical protein
MLKRGKRRKGNMTATRPIQIRSVHIRGPQPGQVATVDGITEANINGQWLESYVARFPNGDQWLCPLMATKDYERMRQ